MDQACTQKSFPKSVRLFCVLALALTMALAVVISGLTFAAPALATTHRALSASFGSAGGGDGQFELLQQPEESKSAQAGNLASGLAVSGKTHDVYVTDTGNHRVDEFSSSGELVRAFGADVGGAGVDVCTSGCGRGTVTSSPGGFEEPVFVAVDNSGGPSAGDVYVADTRTDVVSKFDREGGLIASWGVGGQLNGSSATGPIAGPFGAIAGITVDPSGNLWVYDEAGDMFEFAQDGSFVTDWSSGLEGYRSGIGADAAGDLIVSEPSGGSGGGYVGGSVVAFTPGGEKLGVVIEEVGTYLAVDPVTNTVFRDNSQRFQFRLGFDAFPIEPFEGAASESEIGSGVIGEEGTLAVDPVTGDVYFADMKDKRIDAFVGPFTFPAVVTQPASGITGSSAQLNGTVNSEGIPLKECYFEYGPIGASGQKALCEPDAENIPTDSNAHAVHATISLPPDTMVHYRLVAANAHVEYGGDESVPVPTGEADAVHTIDGEDAISVFGIVNPDGSTRYWFEFVTEKQFTEGSWTGAISTEAQSGSGFVVQPIPALAAGATYHYRLAVEGSALPGVIEHSQEVRTLKLPAPTPESQLTCPNEAERTGASAVLPDCRAYEQVTPVDKGGATDNFDYAEGTGETVIGTDGKHMIFETQSKWGESVSGTLLNSYLFTRGLDGWGMTSLAPQPQTGVVKDESKGFDTPDLSQVLLERAWETSPNAASANAEFALGPPGGPYTTAVSEPQKHKVPTGKELAVPGEDEVERLSHWVAQSRDGSVAVIESTDHELVQGKKTGTTFNHVENDGTSDGYDLYEYSGGNLSQVNVDSEGKTIGECGAWMVEGREGGGSRGKGQSTEKGGISLATGSINAVSSHGTRIFFEAFPNGCPNREEAEERYQGEAPSKLELYMRLNGNETVDIGNYTFEGANPEGTRVLLAKRGPGGIEYLSYNTETRSAKPLFSLKGAALGPKHALSEDGDVYYFEAIGSPLTPEAPANANDIYRYDIPAETISFVSESFQNEGNGDGGFYTSPDGGDFYFNVNSVPGVSGSPGGSPQVYRYDSAEDVVQCVSCASSFDPEPKLISTLMPGESSGPSADRLAPLGSPASANGNYVFFDTVNALLPQDVNGEIEPTGGSGGGAQAFSPSSDVYEWRRYAVDGCGLVQGCLALISSGIDGTENVLLGTDMSGQNVFIGTHSQLVGQDKDHSGDIYDVRIDGGFPAPAPRPTECEGDACSTPASAPSDATPSSFTFSGPGNLTGGQEPSSPASSPSKATVKKVTKCKKPKRSSRGKCVKQKKKARKASRAGHGRGMDR